MPAPKTLREQEALADRGFECVSSCDYKGALRIAERLKKSRYTACFEIAALAYAGMAQMEEAVGVLKEGTAIAPDVWVNWELLGNYLSDLGRYEEAENALQHAMECPGAWIASISLNMAVLESRKGNLEECLNILLDIDDPEVELPAAAIRISVLEDLGRNEDVKTQASELLAREFGDDADLEPLARICASLGNVWLLEGRDTAEIRTMLKEALDYDVCCFAILDLIRKIDGRPGPNAYVYRCLVDFTGDFGDMCAKGYCSTFDVIAEDEQQAANLIKAHEDSPLIRKMRVLEKARGDHMPGEALGIYSRGPRMFYKK